MKFRILPPFASLRLASALVATTLVTATVSAYTDADIVINAGITHGTLGRVASGFLTPFNNPPVAPPASADYAALKVKRIRLHPNYAAATVAIDQAAGGSALIIPCLSDGWGYPLINSAPPWGANPYAPDWTAWRQKVTDMVTATQNLPLAFPPIYDVWNEPDSGGFFNNWLPGWTDQQKADLFFELYVQTYNAIRAVNPALKITAPGNQSFTGAANTVLTVEWFKNKCVAAGKIPTYWNWHFGNTSIEAQVATAKSWGLNSGVLVLEYLEAQQGRRPGRVAYDIAQLESAGVVFSVQARWPNDKHCGNSYTDNLFTAKTGNWFLHKFYADMTGTRISALAPIGVIPYRALASLDTNQRKLFAILGDSTVTGTNGDVTLKLKGIKAYSGTAVNVTIKQIPFYGEHAAVAGPATIRIAAYAPDASGNLTIPPFNWGAVEQAYTVEITNITTY